MVCASKDVTLFQPSYCSVLYTDLPMDTIMCTNNDGGICTAMISTFKASSSGDAGTSFGGEATVQRGYI